MTHTRERLNLPDLTLAEFHQGTRAAMLDDWEPSLVAPIIVSRRKHGELVVIDGWRRVNGARRAGMETIEADVFHGLSREDEQRMFVDINSRRPRD